MLRAAGRRLAAASTKNPFQKLQKTVEADGKTATYYDLKQLQGYNKLPITTRVLLEAAVRKCDNFMVTEDDVNRILDLKNSAANSLEVQFVPARVILQDFTGVPCVVDLAAMRDAVKALGGNPEVINPHCPVDLVIDHSVIVDYAGTPDALEKNQTLEFERNKERFQFLKWGSGAFNNLRIVPPGAGIVHQVNLEYLARVVFNEKGYLYPDSAVGTDSHTTMVNGMGVLAWGVGGVEAEAAMLGNPMSITLPKVVGVRLTGKAREGVTATDCVLAVTQMLRKHGVVGKFVEFYGPALQHMGVEDRATIGNMAPEYGATCGFFPVDDTTLAYMRETGRKQAHIDRVKGYLSAVDMFGHSFDGIEYTENLALDLSTVEPCVSGPKRPQDRVTVKDLPADFKKCLENPKQDFKGFGLKAEDLNAKTMMKVHGEEVELKHGSVFIAAITSCTNTSNPNVMLGAGLLAKNAVNKGLKVPGYVKTSLSPGSGIVKEYFERSGLQPYLDKVGFNITGFGCMTCIGNSGDIPEPYVEAIIDKKIVGAAVLSGNRNFEARVHPNLAAAYLMSPMLVVAYALAGNVNVDFNTQPLGKDDKGRDVFLRDIWPTNDDIKTLVKSSITPELFEQVYQEVTQGNAHWRGLKAPTGNLYAWDSKSTYIHKPPYFDGMTMTPSAPSSVKNASCLLYLGDSVTTDHISPAGRIAKNSPAARFLSENGVEYKDFNSYGTRRGNDLVMTRGTFANVKLGNKIIGEGTTGPKTIFKPTGEELSVFDAAVKYKAAGIPTVVLAGKEYGSGSSRDWAAKGTEQLGIVAVFAESYERIHRSNLAALGVLPFEFKAGQSAQSLGLTGKEDFSFDLGAVDQLKPRSTVKVTAGDNTFEATLRLDTLVEVAYYQHHGVLPFVVRQMAKNSQ
jgi:aconitate hydratase